LTSTKSQLEDSLRDLDERETVATLAMRQPCDELIPETEFVVLMEADVQGLLKLCERSDDDQTDGDVSAATQKCDALEATVADRRQTLREREYTLEAKKAAQRRPPQIQVGPSAEEWIPQMQLITAQNIVAGVFNKMQKRHEAIDSENESLDELADRYQKQREPVKRSWKEKVDAITELQRQLLMGQRLVLDVAAAAAKVDRLNRDLLEGKYHFHRLQRQAALL
jgi:hypothetical protein